MWIGAMHFFPFIKHFKIGIATLSLIHVSVTVTILPVDAQHSGSQRKQQRSCAKDAHGRKYGSTGGLFQLPETLTSCVPYSRRKERGSTMRHKASYCFFSTSKKRKWAKLKLWQYNQFFLCIFVNLVLMSYNHLMLEPKSYW